jgi:multiple sugar transport system permease protein
MSSSVPAIRADHDGGRVRHSARPPAGPGGSSGKKAFERRRSLTRSIPLLPASVLLVVFLIGPIIASFYGSFTDSALSGTAASNSSFIGLDNYIALFTNTGFPNAVLLTVVFVFASAVIGQNILGLALALLQRNSNRVVSAIVGTIVVTPWVLPEVVAAFASYAFYTNQGTVNSILAAFGIAGPEWLYTFPLLAVIVANIWRGTAFSMLVYSAALSDIPPEITEAAEMDGAGGWKRLRQVTIPMIRRSIATNSMIITLQTLSAFTIIYVMTAGGPGQASTTLPVLAYQQAFKNGQIGYGTAIATMLLIVGAIFSIVYIRALSKDTD